MKTDRQQATPPASDVRRRRQPQAAAAAAAAGLRNEGVEHQRRTTWPLEIYTLGRFDVRIEGAPLKKTRKAPHRLLDLLQAIVAGGGSAVPVSRLINQLWPHSEGTRGSENFKK